MNEKRWDKLAEEYHKFIISPFQREVKNPLFQEIGKIKNRKEKIIADFGCGRCELGSFLIKNFKEVYAFDFSDKMIEEAKKNKENQNIKFSKINTLEINLKNKFDIATSINSIIMPSILEIKKSLKNIHNSLKNKGKFFLIVPSMESVIYEGMLVLNRELGVKEEKEIEKSKKICEDLKYDYFLGHYKDGKDVQKFYYLHEIFYYLSKAGFKNINIKKVEYPWKKEISDYENFPKEEPLWDWFVSCDK
jgi:2-polyprenyl-3-methyl-5-hydroxy-6-metoxy-1,4-benzoquinol methylase